MSRLRAALKPARDHQGSLLWFFEGLTQHDYPVCQLAKPGGAMETVMSRPFLRHILDWSVALEKVPDRGNLLT